jgi:hypothetical protein
MSAANPAADLPEIQRGIRDLFAPRDVVDLRKHAGLHPPVQLRKPPWSLGLRSIVVVSKSVFSFTLLPLDGGPA